MKTNLELLTTLVVGLTMAKAIIDTPEKWVQRAMAKNVLGDVTRESDPGAVCFCSLGAIRKNGLAFKDQNSNQMIIALNAASPYDNIVSANDNSTHAEVMAIWDKAIAKAKAEVLVAQLEAAKEKIALPSAWTKRDYAKDAAGNSTEGWGKDAVCFCAYGAVEAATGKAHSHGHKTSAILDQAAKDVSGERFVQAANFNDSSTHAEVLQMFDRAIELAKQEVN